MVAEVGIDAVSERGDMHEYGSFLSSIEVDDPRTERGEGEAHKLKWATATGIPMTVNISRSPATTCPDR